MVVQIIGLDALQNLLIDRAANPSKYASVNSDIENGLLTSVDAVLGLAVAVLSQPAQSKPQGVSGATGTSG